MPLRLTHYAPAIWITPLGFTHWTVLLWLPLSLKRNWVLLVSMIIVLVFSSFTFLFLLFLPFTPFHLLLPSNCLTLVLAHTCLQESIDHFSWLLLAFSCHVGSLKFAVVEYLQHRNWKMLKSVPPPRNDPSRFSTESLVFRENLLFRMLAFPSISQFCVNCSLSILTEFCSMHVQFNIRLKFTDILYADTFLHTASTCLELCCAYSNFFWFP